MRRRIRRLLQSDGRVEVAGEHSTLRSLQECGRPPSSDLVFAPFEGDDSSLAPFPAPPEPPLLILISTSERFAAQAFEIGAFDYLIAPVDEQRLKTAIGRASRCLQAQRQRSAAQIESLLSGLREVMTQTNSKALHRTRIPVHCSDRVRFIDTDSLSYIQASGKYVELNTVGGQRHLVRMGISRLADELDPRRFLRIHRSYVVNVEKIDEISYWAPSQFLVQLPPKVRLTSGKRYYDALRRLIRL